jgi:endonuclease-3
MKPARKIVETIMGAIGEAAFPGHDSEGNVNWRPDPFHVLISTVLSQRTRDQNTHNASSRLFSRFDDPGALADAPLEEIVELIRPAGFPGQKGKAIKEIARVIHYQLGDRVPSTVEGLTALPMVGLKTANCVLSYAFRIPAICVDTHVHRVSNRIGLVRTRAPDETEEGLRKAVPKDLWIDINAIMVPFGQTICLPRQPRCPACPVRPYCDYYEAVFKKDRSDRNGAEGR